MIVQMCTSATSAVASAAHGGRLLDRPGPQVPARGFVDRAFVPGAELALAGDRAAAKGMLPGAERLESRPTQPLLERNAVGGPLRGRVAAEHVGRVVLGDWKRGQVRVEIGEATPVA